MHLKVLRKLRAVIKCKVFVFLELDHISCEYMLSQQQQTDLAQKLLPSQKRKLPTWYPYRNMNDRCAEELSHLGWAGH